MKKKKRENKPKHKENAYCSAMLEYSSNHNPLRVQFFVQSYSCFFWETIIPTNREVADII